MPMMTIGGINVPLAIANGMGGTVEDLSDRARAISGDLLITQLSGTVGDFKSVFACQTIPMDVTARDALLTALRSAAVLAVTGDVPVTSASAVVTAINPVTLPGPTRRWVVSFQLIEN